MPTIDNSDPSPSPHIHTAHTHIHKLTAHMVLYIHIYSQITMIAASVYKDPDQDISWLKPYWWVRQSFSHMLGNSEYRTSIPLSGHCSPRGLTTLLIACLILETSCVQMTLRDPLLTMWTLLLRYLWHCKHLSCLQYELCFTFHLTLLGYCGLGCILLFAEKGWEERGCRLLWQTERGLCWILDEECFCEICW